ncbi:MAG: dTMP kinase [Calditrichaceae bacterium]|nr:dTMP kinase [Calditrichaceae bacterium]MBN2709494.1 dTMP kinase [Calditrichaceae bacterium]RQV95958.1 MAG: dTMP kinase [Calditrichota bacterium]
MKKTDNRRFISFEGIDYSGKSSQINLLRDYLSDKGFEVYVLREPGGTIISEKIREILLDKKNNEMDKMAEIFLYSAARIQLTNEKIAPLLIKGYYVLADRFVDSTTAYQGFGREINLDLVKKINEAATGGLMPGLTFYLEIEPKLAALRRVESGRTEDRLEKSGIEFYNRVFEGYKKIAKQEPGRVKVIDARLSIEEIHRQIIKIININ